MRGQAELLVLLALLLSAWPVALGSLIFLALGWAVNRLLHVRDGIRGRAR